MPDAIVIEHPRLAGGHLGAARLEDLGDRRFDFDVVLPEVRQILERMGVDIPLVAAGGVGTSEDIRRLQALGAAAVQVGTAFAVTLESDAHLAFKQVLASARPEDIVEFTSVAGLPARAVRTPWLDKYLRLRERLQEERTPRVTARCGSTASSNAACAMARRSGVSSASTRCWATPSPATRARACSSAAPGVCPSATRSAA